MEPKYNIFVRIVQFQFVLTVPCLAMRFFFVKIICLSFFQHKNHEFEKIEKVYDLHIEKINKEAYILKKKLKYSKETKLNEITNVAEKCHQRLENELKERLINLHKEKKALAEEIDCFDDMHTHITQ